MVVVVVPTKRTLLVLPSLGAKMMVVVVVVVVAFASATLMEKAPRRQFPLSGQDSPLQHLRLRYFRVQRAGWTWAEHLAAHEGMRGRMGWLEGKGAGRNFLGMSVGKGREGLEVLGKPCPSQLTTQCSVSSQTNMGRALVPAKYSVESVCDTVARSIPQTSVGWLSDEGTEPPPRKRHKLKS